MSFSLHSSEHSQANHPTDVLSEVQVARPVPARDEEGFRWPNPQEQRRPCLHLLPARRLQNVQGRRYHGRRIARLPRDEQDATGIRAPPGSPVCPCWHVQVRRLPNGQEILEGG